MCIYFGIDLLNSGQYGRFFCIAGAETLVIVLAFFALRKRDRLRQQRKINKAKRQSIDARIAVLLY